MQLGTGELGPYVAAGGTRIQTYTNWKHNSNTIK